MKSLTKSIFALASVMVLGACSSDKDSFDGFDYSGKSTVEFTSNISTYSGTSTRVVNNTWETADAIGLFATNAGTSLENGNIFNEKSNIKYTTVGGATAKFVAATPTQALQIKGKESVDVVAYYPYSATVKDFVLPIDLTQQGTPGKIDVLYSNNGTKISTANMSSSLTFTHQLSKVVLEVEVASGSAAALTAKDLTNVFVNGQLNLVDGVASIKEGAKEVTIQPLVKVSGNKAIVEAILLPGQNMAKSQVTLQLNGQTFIWAPQNDIALIASKKFTYKLKLGSDGTIVIINPEGNIEDWVEGNPNDDTIILTPEEGENGGETPTPGDVMSLKDFRTKYAGALQAPMTITEDVEIKGVVTSSDAAGNIFKNLFIEDETAGVVFRLSEAKDIAQHYPIGTELTVNLKDFIVTQFNNSLQIKAAENAEISFAVLDAAIKEKKTGKVTPKIVTGAEVGAANIHRLVQLNGVKFKDAGQPYFSGSANGADRIIETKDGKDIVVRISKFATFKNDIIPSGEMNVVAVVDVFKDAYQLFIRDTNDVVAGGGENPGPVEPKDEVSVDNTYMQFVALGETKNLAITATSPELVWSVVAGDSWVTLDKNSGKGTGAVKVTAIPNTATTDRTTTITLKSDKQNDVVITVFQSATIGGSTGEEVVISLETFGLNDGTKFDVAFGDIDAYSGFTSKAGIVVSNKGSRADIRARSNAFNFEKLTWFPAYNSLYPISPENPAPTFDFSNIETVGFTNLKVSYKLSGNTAKNENVSVKKMHVYVDGKELEVPENTFTTGAWTEVELSISAPFSQLTFKTDEQNSTGIRLDDVKIVGTK